MMRLLIAVVLSVTLAGNAQALGDSVSMSGNKLLGSCNGPPLSWQNGFCMGYISGIVDGRNETSFCIPDGVTRGQVTDIVKFWLRENPATRHLRASRLIIDALWDKFPCH